MDYSLPGSSVHGISKAKYTRVGCYFLLPGIFPNPGSNSCLLHQQVDSLPLSKLLELKKKKTNQKTNRWAPARPHTFLRPSSSSSARGPAWSFSRGLTKGDACLVSGLRLGDRMALVGTVPPCELMDSSERWGLPVREPVWGWEVLKEKKKKKVIPSGTQSPLTILTFSNH